MIYGVRILEFLGEFLLVYLSVAADFLSALLGAAAGATAAFLFQRSYDERKQAEERHGAIILAQTSLIGMLNTIRNLQQQHLEPNRQEKVERSSLPLIWHESSSIAIDYASLAFVVTRGFPELPLQVQIAERTFRSVMSAVHERNKAFERICGSELLSYDPKTHTAGLGIDPRDQKRLWDSTATLYSHVGNSEGIIKEAVLQLREAGKRILPKELFLNTGPKVTDSQRTG